MGLLVPWLRRLVVVVLTLGFCELLLPEGEIHRFARVILGLLVTLLLFQPLLSLFGRDFDLDAFWSGYEPGVASGDPTRAAARISEAGLSALRAAGEEEMALEIRSFCRGGLGLGEAEVAVAAAAEGTVKVTLRLKPPADPARVREAIRARYGLPETAVEVIVDG